MNNETEKQKIKFKDKIKKFPHDAAQWFRSTPRYFRVFLSVAALCALLHIISGFIPAFADFMIRYPNSAVRWALAQITNFFPFSLAEMVVMLLPIIVFVLFYFCAYFCKEEHKKGYTRYLCFLLSVLCTFFPLFVLTLAPGYRGTTLANKLELEQKDVSASELYDTSLWLSSKIENYTDKVSYGNDGFSHMPYSLDTMCEKLNDAYSELAKEYKFISKLRSNLKYVILSEPMTYTHISGVYTFYTGEANLNVNFPDYTLPFTAAHELAHQRGTAPENEANFVAFLACMKSDDPYIQYSGYVNMLEYCMSALSEADSSLYIDFYKTLDKKVVGEFYAYSDFYEKYRENVAASVSGTINDTYLQSQGQSAGTRSYGLVVDLAVAYYHTLDD